MRLKILFFFLFFVICFLGKAQIGNYRFINFSIKDGLPDKFIYSATQDKKGYMWFGTATGLYRYDGHIFKYYRSPLDKAGNSIANILQAVHTDDEGNLWLGSLTSLQWYNPSKNTFWQPKNTDVNSHFIVNFSKGKYTWLSTNKNFVYRFNNKDSSFLSLANQYPKTAGVASIITVENGNFLYDIHPEGIYIFSIEGKYQNFIQHLPADIANGFYSKNDNAIYLSSYQSGVLKFDLVTLTIKEVDPQNKALKLNNLLSINRKEDGTFFLVGYPLHVLNTNKNVYLSFFSKEDKNEFSIGASKIANIFCDRENNVWFCGHSGLAMLPWQNSQIITLPLKDETTGAVTEPIGVYQEPKTNNLLIINTSSSGLQYLDLNTKQSKIITNTATKQAIKSLIIAPDSSVYASDDINFFKYNAKDKTLAPYLLKDQNNKGIGAIARHVTDANGNIFIGAVNNGFYKWNYTTNKLWHYNKWDVTDNKGVDNKDNNIMPCIIDRKQNVWFTSSNGIYEYNQKENKYTLHTPPVSNDVAAMGASNYIAEDLNGHIWIATINNGIYEMYYENRKQIWKNYTKNSGIGLSTDYCQKIKLNPGDSTLWLSTLSGILKFDPNNRKVLSWFSMQNGLAQEGGGYSFNIFSNKQLAVLFYGALNLLDLKTYVQNNSKPHVALNSIKVLNEEVYFSLDSTKPVLHLQHNQNYLQFEFAALVYNNGNKNQYAYMLEGLDKEWIYTGQKNIASYSGLNPGSYVFKVKAANSDGLWGDETVVKIIIKSPIYKRGWFILLSLLLFSSLIYGWNKYRVNQTKKEEHLKASFQQQIAATEMKALRAQMNPHFIFNSLNSIQKYILQNDHFAASQYLTKFSRLIRLILDHSNQNTILLSGELDLLRLYIEMESLRFDNSFTYTIHVEDNINTETVLIPSMLIQPYVENAIWHGLLHKEDKGHLVLHFSLSKSGSLNVIIEDNGVGREKATQLKSKQVLKKKSYGMQITEKSYSHN
ncbi:MAG: histidine kinase [Chitinophagaceae bacterium]|nr:histidine kinase [Chitinophagaceae bacterium]